MVYVGYNKLYLWWSHLWLCYEPSIVTPWQFNSFLWTKKAHTIFMVGKSTIFLCVMASSSLMIPPGCAFLFFGGQASQSVEVPFQALCNLDGNIPGLMGHIHGNIPVFFFWSVIIYHISLDIHGDLSLTGACVLRRVAGWVAGGCWDDKNDS